MKVFTIGYSRKTAKQFFTLLQQPGLVRLVDVRLSNNNAMAGFTRKNNFPFFLKEICNIEYVHRLDLAPDRNMMDPLRSNPLAMQQLFFNLLAEGQIDTTFPRRPNREMFKEMFKEQYKEQFFKLLAQRKVETTVPREVIDGGCLLCSEPSANDCHRKMVTDYLQEKWGDLEVIHL